MILINFFNKNPTNIDMFFNEYKKYNVALMKYDACLEIVKN
jgi:hypothetical protein